MREEVSAWMQKAGKYLDDSRFNHKGKRYDVAAFLAQQAAEKALKALYILRKNELWKIHDLVKLGKELSAPQDILDSCERLNQHYIATRHPVDAEYSGEDVSEAIEDSEKVIEWVNQKLK